MNVRCVRDEQLQRAGGGLFNRRLEKITFCRRRRTRSPYISFLGVQHNTRGTLFGIEITAQLYSVLWRMWSSSMYIVGIACNLDCQITSKRPTECVSKRACGWLHGRSHVVVDVSKTMKLSNSSPPPYPKNAAQTFETIQSWNPHLPRCAYRRGAPGASAGIADAGEQRRGCLRELSTVSLKHERKKVTKNPLQFDCKQKATDTTCCAILPSPQDTNNDDAFAVAWCSRVSPWSTGQREAVAGSIQTGNHCSFSQFT